MNQKITRTYLLNEKVVNLREKHLKKASKPKCSEFLYDKIVAANIYYIELASKIFNHDFDVPIIRCDISSVHTCGWAELKTNVVNYNPSYFELDLDYHLKDTVGYEIAHIVAFVLYNESQHGKMWKYVMYKLGLEPERTLKSTITLEPVRKKKVVIYKCACRTYEIGQTKHNNLVKKNSHYLECKYCKQRCEYQG